VIIIGLQAFGMAISSFLNGCSTVSCPFSARFKSMRSYSNRLDKPLSRVTFALHYGEFCHWSNTLRIVPEMGICPRNVCEAPIMSTCTASIDALDLLRRLGFVRGRLGVSERGRTSWGVATGRDF
jgi:hypothetical protein